MIYGDQDIMTKIFYPGLVKNAIFDQVNPASINIRLGYTFSLPVLGKREEDPPFIELGKKIDYNFIDLRKPKKKGLLLPPGKFVLGTTIEEFTIPDNVAAFVQGRSSIGRVGLTIQNAGFVDPGFHGHITLELVNESEYPILLKPEYPVGQLIFFETGKVLKPYEGKYNGQVEATGSRMFMDKINKEGE